MRPAEVAVVGAHSFVIGNPSRGWIRPTLSVRLHGGERERYGKPRRKFSCPPVDHGPDVEPLLEGAPGNVFGQFLDRRAGLDPWRARLAQEALVEGNIPRTAEDYSL
jgi:hypothetical protein